RFARAFKLLGSVARTALNSGMASLGCFWFIYSCARRSCVCTLLAACASNLELENPGPSRATIDATLNANPILGKGPRLKRKKSTNDILDEPGTVVVATVPGVEGIRSSTLR